MAAIAAATGGVLAVQPAAHAAETRADGAVTTPSTTPPPPGTGAEVVRYSGSDRYDTAVEVSRSRWFTGSGPAVMRAQAVVLATGESFPDALAGGPLAASAHGPLLLTEPNSLPDGTRTEILRVLPTGGTIYILGKYGAVSQGVESELRGLGYRIVRLGGNDRFETSRIIAAEVVKHVPPTSDGSPVPAVLATGTTFADALPAGPLASLVGAPIVLTDGPTMDSATRTFLGSTRRLLPVGGPAYKAAGMKPVDDGYACDDLAGSDRYSTSADVAGCIAYIRDFTGLDPVSIMGVATGLNYPDALTGGALMGLYGEPLVLTDPNSLSPQTATALTNASPRLTMVDLFGGTGALSTRVEQQVVAAVGGVDMGVGLFAVPSPSAGPARAAAPDPAEGDAWGVSSAARNALEAMAQPGAE